MKVLASTDNCGNKRPPLIFIVNVGVNLAHELYSVVYDDLTFEFVPIPLSFQAQPCSRSVSAYPVTYSKLQTFDGKRPLLSLFPDRLAAKYADVVAHNDPLLEGKALHRSPRFSYGDVPLKNPRAVNLRHAAPGDSLLFLANLRRFPGSSQAVQRPARSLYFIGMLAINDILQYEPAHRSLLRPHTGEWEEIGRYTHNAHINQLLALPDDKGNEPFTIFEGGAGSQRFLRAVPITEELCRSCLRDRQGVDLDYARYRTLNACVGVYTRTVRPHFDLAQAEDRQRYARLLEFIARNNGIALPD